MQTQFPEGTPVPFALHQERERLLNSPAPVAHGNTMAHVIDRYERSPAFCGLAPRTQKDYRKRLDFLTQKIGHLEPKSIERHHVIRWRDEWAKKKPHEANYRLRVLRIMMERAIDFGLLPTGGNCAKGVAEVKYEKREREPWPDNLVDEARGVANPPFVLPCGSTFQLDDAAIWPDPLDMCVGADERHQMGVSGTTELVKKLVDEL
ncbi:MAG: hypothetical protein AAF479_16235 [Pseudomonadota bacterium]